MKHKEKGFTLIEVIVSTAIFLLIIGIGIGVFISIISYQKKILRQQQLLNQMSYAQEHIAKAIRMASRDISGDCLVDGDGNSYPGYNYLLTRPVSGFYTGIKFLNQSDEDGSGPACVEFYLDSTTHVLKEKKTYYSGSSYPQVSDDQAVAITSTAFDMQLIRFGINGTNGCYGAGCPVGDQDSGYESLQPRVTVAFKVRIQGDNQAPLETIQTTISQRNLNAQ